MKPDRESPIEAEVEAALLAEVQRLGLTQEQSDILWRWALTIYLSMAAIDGLVDGSMQIAGLTDDGDPKWDFTQKGRAELMKLRKYRCVHCGKVMLRESRKQWIKSWCDVTERTVHLQRVATSSRTSPSA